MSIKLPDNRTEKKARYKMLVEQGSMTLKKAQDAYAAYLRNTNQKEN